MIRKLIAIAVSVLLMGSIFVGCGNNKATSAPSSSESKAAETASTGKATGDSTKKVSGKVSFMTYRNDLLESWYPKALEDFKAKFPDITVETSTSANWDQDLKVRMSSNDLPDVFTVSGDRYSDAQRSQYMLALDDVFPDLVQNWAFNDVNKNQDDKKTYALTYGGQGVGLAYNKKMFAEMGLKAPKTLDELIDTAKKIKAKGKIGFVGCFKPGWTTQPYYWIAQAMFGDQIAEYKKMVGSDTPFTVESSWGKMAQVLVKLRDAKIMEDDPISYDWEPYLKDSGSNKAGMAFTWTNTPVQWPGRGDGSMKVEDIGFVPFPYDNSGGPYKVFVQADWGLAVAKSSKNLEAAKTFYNWHMGDYFPQYAKETAVISPKKGFVTDVSYLKEFNDAKPEIVNAVAYPADFKSLLDKAQIDLWHQYAEIATGTDIQKEFDKMNAAWKKSKGK